MRKSTTLLIGLFLSTMAVTGCGNKDKHKEPERGEFTYNIEFKEVYEGRKALEATKNLENQLQSSKLVNVNGKMDVYNKNSSISYTTSKQTLDATFYKNNVITQEMISESCYEMGNFSVKSEQKDTISTVFFEKQAVEMEDQISDDDFSHGVDVYEWDNSKDISSYIGLSSISRLGGTYGIDKNGNGLLYDIYIDENDHPGYTSLGTSTDVYDYEIRETLIMFDGTPLTGKPWGIFVRNVEVKYYDDAYVKVEKGIETHHQIISYDITYGKRKDYKNKDALIKEMRDEKISEPVDYYMNQYQGVVASSDKKSLTSVPSSYNNVPVDGFVDGLSNNGKRNSGLFENEYTLELQQDEAYAFMFDVETSFASYDSTTKEYAMDGMDESVIAEIKCDNLPEGLYIAKDYKNDQYLYASKDIHDVNFEVDWEVTVVKSAGIASLKATANVTFID